LEQQSNIKSNYIANFDKTQSLTSHVLLFCVFALPFSTIGATHCLILSD